MKKVIRASRYPGYQSQSQKTNAQPVMAAGEEDDELDLDLDADFDSGDSSDGGDVADTIDNVADAMDDIQDSIDEVQQDDVSIELDNNIANHYIAECDNCHGVFISATVESDQVVEKVTGVCPLCGKESDQYLKWVIRDVETKENSAGQGI